MNPPTTIQFHFFVPYANALLNRDDAGQAKRALFGGVDRTRISSQCLKFWWRRHIQRAQAEATTRPAAQDTVRSRYIFEELVYKPVSSLPGIDPTRLHIIVNALSNAVLGTTEKPEEPAKKRKGAKEVEGAESAEKALPPLMTSQVVALGRAEIKYLETVALQAHEALIKTPTDKLATALQTLWTKDHRENFKAIPCAGGLTSALFGRMVTGDVLARTDAAMNVAHAFTVHADMTDADYFTALDDLENKTTTRQSAHLGTTELSSGLFYHYVVIDVGLLVNNVTGGIPFAKAPAHQQQYIRDLITVLTETMLTVGPEAKRGGTAPFSAANAVLVELSRGGTPVSGAEAFLTPVVAGEQLPNRTMHEFTGHRAQLQRMYPKLVPSLSLAMGADMVKYAGTRLNAVPCDSVNELTTMIAQSLA